MLIKLQGKWEAERVARIVRLAGMVDASVKAWGADCAARIERQVEMAKNAD